MRFCSNFKDLGVIWTPREQIDFGASSPHAKVIAQAQALLRILKVGWPVEMPAYAGKEGTHVTARAHARERMPATIAPQCR